MGSRSMVGIAIVGPLDKLNEILAMPGIKEFWGMSDLDVKLPPFFIIKTQKRRKKFGY